MFLIIPTFNAGERWASVIESIAAQSFKPLSVFVIDSGSSDQTVSLARAAGFEVEEISSSNFDHGGTRQGALSHVKKGEDIVVFMTQDAQLASPEDLARLIEPFDDPQVAVVFGRQLPHEDATPLAAQARAFNYPELSMAKTYEDRERLGIKTPFCSNSFAAYRMSALKEVGGFPVHTIMGEDMLVAAKCLKQGYTVFYQSKACVHHSHNYTLLEEFRRYFDTGVFHREAKDTLKDFGGVGGEGLKLLRAQLQLAKPLGTIEKTAFALEVIFRNALKLMAYKLGQHHNCLPLRLKRQLSLFRTYWSKA